MIGRNKPKKDPKAKAKRKMDKYQKAKGETVKVKDAFGQERVLHTKKSKARKYARATSPKFKKEDGVVYKRTGVKAPKSGLETESGKKLFRTTTSYKPVPTKSADKTSLKKVKHKVKSNYISDRSKDGKLNVRRSVRNRFKK